MDKNLFLYKDSKKTFVLIGILTALQSVAIISQAGFLAKADRKSVV